eukprot:c52602_g1_i1 orf=67-255(+)
MRSLLLLHIHSVDISVTFSSPIQRQLSVTRIEYMHNIECNQQAQQIRIGGSHGLSSKLIGFC